MTVSVPLVGIRLKPSALLPQGNNNGQEYMLLSVVYEYALKCSTHQDSQCSYNVNTVALETKQFLLRVWLI